MIPDFMLDFLTDNELATDIIENENEFVVHLMLPGFRKSEVSIKTKREQLIIKGKRTENDENNYIRKNSYFGEFTKKYVLPDIVDKNSISAKYEYGVLIVNIPKDVEKNKTSEIIIK